MNSGGGGMMGHCSHGINTMNRRCDRCTEVAEAENRSALLHNGKRRVVAGTGRPHKIIKKKFVSIDMEVTDNQLEHIRAHLRMIQIPFSVRETED